MATGGTPVAYIGYVQFSIAYSCMIKYNLNKLDKVGLLDNNPPPFCAKKKREEWTYDT